MKRHCINPNGEHLRLCQPSSFRDTYATDDLRADQFIALLVHAERVDLCHACRVHLIGSLFRDSLKSKNVDNLDWTYFLTKADKKLLREHYGVHL
jgi:hypothetical protein